VNPGSYAYLLFKRERLNGDSTKLQIYKGVTENKVTNSLMLRTVF
jgi:hypothetical protein